MNVLANDKSRKAKPRAFSGLLRSYGADLKGWLAKLAAGYGIAAALMLGGVLAVFGTVTVGFIALFHFVELHYGAYIAFAVLGSGLLVLGIILLLIGWAMMSGRAAPLPRPRRQLRAARQMLVGPTILRAVGAFRDSEAAKPDATTQVMLGAAAIIALAWLVATNRGSKPTDRVRR